MPVSCTQGSAFAAKPAGDDMLLISVFAPQEILFPTEARFVSGISFACAMCYWHAVGLILSIINSML